METVTFWQQCNKVQVQSTHRIYMMTVEAGQNFQLGSSEPGGGGGGEGGEREGEEGGGGE